MKIAERSIGGDSRPYIIAEISGNHCGSIDNAKRLIKAAKRAGADAVKTQCYEPESMTLQITKPDFIVQNGLWRGKTLYDIYQKCHTPFAWHKDLYRLARNEGITIFSSVFDARGVDLLETLGCPTYKIASFEIVDTPLIQYAASTEKPLIISTGLARDREILDAMDATKGNAAFLHCTSEYPGRVENADLCRMGHIDTLLGFRCPIGISDHTEGWIIPVAATAMRACIIEKHLKLDDGSQSEDNEFSLSPLAFSEMVKAVHATHAALHEATYDTSARQFRRSLYVVRDIKEGEVFTTQNVRSIRPSYGSPPKMLNFLLGKKAKRDWKRGEPLNP